MPSREEAIFCKIAIKNNLLTIEQCKECIRLKKSGGTSLSAAFVEKGYLSARMADVIKRLQERVSEEEAENQRQKDTFDAGKTQQIDTCILDEISSEITDSSTDLKLNLTDLGETIHPDIVADDKALPPKIIGNDTFMKNLSAEEQEEIARMGNFLPEVRKSDNVVYNVNVQNYTSGQDAEEPTGNAIALRRSDLSDAQMLALIKGEQINLPIPQQVLEAQMPMRYVAAGQETIMAAVQKNMLISLLSVLALVLLGGIVAAAMVFGPDRADNHQDIVIKTGPQNPGGANPDQSLRGKPLYAVLDLLDPRKSPLLRKQGCDELSWRLQKEEDRTAIEPLVRICLHDDSKEISDEARAALKWVKKNEALLQATMTQLVIAYRIEAENVTEDQKKRASAKKAEYLKLLDLLEYGDIVPDVLSLAINDADPDIRELAMDLLEKHEPAETLTVMQGFYEKFPGDKISPRILNYFWTKCDKSKVFGDLLAGDKPEILIPTINYVAEFKDSQYMPRYAALVEGHKDVNVKVAAIRALAKFGGAADGVVLDPFDTTVKALKANVEYRKAIVEACRAIRGPNADTILVYLVEFDGDAGIKKAARDIIVGKTGTKPGKDLLDAYDKRVYAAQVEAMAAEIEALAKAIEGKDTKAMASLEAILQNKSKLVDDALIKTDQINRETLAQNIKDTYLKWGYVQLSNGKWVDPWPTWNKLVAQADAKVKAMDYFGATQIVKSIDAKLRENPDIDKNVTNKIDEIRKAGEAQLGIDYTAADDLIKQEKFAEARKLIDTMKQRYTTGDVFTPEYTRYVDLVDRSWKKEEKIYRAWVYRPLKAGATYTEVTKYMLITNVTAMNAETTTLLRADALKDYIRITHNPNGTSWINGSIGCAQTVTFNIRGGKKISDYDDLSFKMHVTKDWVASVVITMNCGAGGTYKISKQLGEDSGDQYKLDPKNWETVTPPSGDNKPLGQVTQIIFDYTFKPKDGKNTKSPAFIDIGEVKFLD